MFPTVKQRVIIATGILIGAGLFAMGKELLMATDAGSGISLISSRVGPTIATGLIAGIGLPVLAMGIFSSSSGHPLSGIFLISTSLFILAGSIEGWLFRSSSAAGSELPQRYVALIVETTLWQIGVLATIFAIHISRKKLRALLPIAATSSHLGDDTNFKLPRGLSLASGLACAMISALLGLILLKDNNAVQIMAGLFIAFSLGSLVTQLILPTNTNPVPLLLSPALVAITTYAYVQFKFQSADEFYAAMWTSRLPGLALALPIHYVSAGVAGVALGIGWAQGLITNQTRPQNAKASSNTG
ncbi:MAG: hypothetical protein CMJ20_05040 [Phycisphaeraceae bacterium]|nr:hypothetical protein [Phycisphaeraceae bacterium]|tara:strand:+ start:2520 stop:3422 length:903 start_codon:yes stop_codon:yes gene_type:complete